MVACIETIWARLQKKWLVVVPERGRKGSILGNIGTRQANMRRRRMSMSGQTNQPNDRSFSLFFRLQDYCMAEVTVQQLNTAVTPCGESEVDTSVIACR